MENILGIAARSLVRHAVVGVLTGGTGNIFMLAGDLMDIHDTIDAVDAVDTISSADADSHGDSNSGHDVAFGANGLDGRYEQGIDHNNKPVAQSGTGPPYNPTDPSVIKDPNDLKWPPATGQTTPSPSESVPKK